MSRLQSASHDSGCSVLGREPETVHRVDHQAACKGWGQGGLSYLAERRVLACCVGFFPRPLLSHLIRLSLPNTMSGVKRAINCVDGGMSSNCPNWSGRHSKSFFGWNPCWKCSSASAGDHFEELFRVKRFFWLTREQFPRIRRRFQ